MRIGLRGTHHSLPTANFTAKEDLFPTRRVPGDAPPYLVDDLTAEREEALRARPGPPMVPLALLLLRSGRSEKLAVLLEDWRPLLAEVWATP
jgi:hypothetical protein